MCSQAYRLGFRDSVQGIDNILAKPLDIPDSSTPDDAQRSLTELCQQQRLAIRALYDHCDSQIKLAMPHVTAAYQEKDAPEASWPDPRSTPQMPNRHIHLYLDSMSQRNLTASFDDAPSPPRPSSAEDDDWVSH